MAHEMTEASTELDQWLKDAGSRVSVLQSEPVRSAAAVQLLGVKPAATIHAVAIRAAGIVVDGWVRVLGGGSSAVEADMASWNGLGSKVVFPAVPNLFTVGFDAAGGVFALDGGALGGVDRAVHYFAPDTLRWESLEGGYTAWLQWLLNEPDDVDDFYSSLRWNAWEDEVSKLSFDEAIQGYPPLWTTEGKDPNRVQRRIMRAADAVAFVFDAARQIEGRDVPGPRGAVPAKWLERA